jgi:uncharacterized protein GlcG (DUF336 family)
MTINIFSKCTSSHGLVRGSAPLIAALLMSTAHTQTAQGAPGDATRKPPQPAAHGPTLESAIEAATAAVEACADKDQHAGVSIVDSAGVLKVLLAADGTSERGVLSSTNKAITALHFKTATSELHKKQETDKAFAQQVAENPNFNARPGGVLLKVGEEIIGAIGVGGAKIDEECALAGIGKIEARPK